MSGVTTSSLSIAWSLRLHLGNTHTIQWKVDRELANHSLSSTASQGTSNIPFPWFLMLGCNSQAQVFIFLSLAVGTIRMQRRFQPSTHRSSIFPLSLTLFLSSSNLFHHLPTFSLGIHVFYVLELFPSVYQR